MTKPRDTLAYADAGPARACRARFRNETALVSAKCAGLCNSRPRVDCSEGWVGLNLGELIVSSSARRYFLGQVCFGSCTPAINSPGRAYASPGTRVTSESVEKEGR